MIRGCIAAFLLTAQPGLGRADDPNTAPAAELPRSMTLEDALRTARKQHPSLSVARADVATREAETAVPRARWQPRLGATAQAVVGTNNNSATSWLGSGGVVEFPRVSGTGYLQRPGEIDWKPYLNTVVGLGLEQRIFDFGRTAAESAEADARLCASRYRALETRLAVELSVREAYYAVLAAKGVLVAAQDAVRRATTHRDETMALVGQGMRARVELERVQADVSRFEVGLLQAQGGLEAAQSVYAAAVGIEASRLDVAGEPPAIPPLPPLEQALEGARKRDPALLALSAERSAQEAETRALRAELRPELKLVAALLGAAGGAPGVGRDKPAYGAGFLPWIPGYFAGVVLAWRLYDAPLAARRKASEREESALGRQRESVRHETAAHIEQAWIGVDVAQRSITALARALDASRANYAQAEARYRSGLGTAVDLADAELLRTGAEIQLALGQFQIARSRAQLTRAIAEGL